MSSTNTQGQIPRGNDAGFSAYLKQDLTSGFLVFLIALPLCLGISIASGFPPIAGVFTAIVGSILTTFISNSELTIKGPAAGLIVIAIGCIEDFGGDGLIGGWTQSDMTAYRAALAIGAIAALLQICFGFFRAGVLGEFFPSAPVHGMLAAIGVIIIIKQFPIALGVTGSGEPLHMLSEFPHYIVEANPAIAAIGLVSLLIMFLWPVVQKRVPLLSSIPSPLVVLLVAVPMGMGFDLLHEHSYLFGNHKYQLGEQFLVRMPDRVFGMFDDITSPDFAALSLMKAWKWVFMFFVIGSLESLLSAKAVDMLDPWHRKTNMNRDIVAVGVGNLAASMIGGLPMISEIVRSRANIDSGARTRFADMWHGVFLLLFVALIPMVLHRIPLAALAAMLIYTGFRLAHPVEFARVYRVGKEQLAIFVTTLIAVLATDLLIGIATGILLKMLIHLVNGVPIRSLFRPFLEVQQIDENTSKIIARESAVFSNWIPFRRQIEQIGLVQRRNVIVDVSNTKLVDHSVMEKLEEMERDFEQEGLRFEVCGLETLRPFTDDHHSARKRSLPMIKRITVTADEHWKPQLIDALTTPEVVRYTVLHCEGTKPGTTSGGKSQQASAQVRIEAYVPSGPHTDVLNELRRKITPEDHVTISVENVEVVNFG